jgi:hypothetical protein
MTSRPTAALRRRGWLLGAGALIIAIGLLVHATASGPAGDFAADALYAVLIYLIVAVLIPRAGSLLVAGIALAFCVAIELFQLTGVPSALAEIAPLTRLVLGTTFAPVDLVAYALGSGLAGASDAAVRHRRFARR